MKRDQSKDGTPSSDTPGEPPPAETPEAPPVVPPAEPNVIPSAESKAVSDVPLVSEELPTGLKPLGRKGGAFVRLSDGIEVSLEGFGQFALQLQAQNPNMDWEDVIPLAASKLCQVKGFFGGLEAWELEFVATHGRRWKPDDGISLQADVLIFDPAQPAESCKVFRARLKGALLPRGDAVLIRRIRECHEIYLQRRDKLGQKERFPPSGKPGGLADTFYPGFEGPIFIGKEIEGLKRYMNIRFAHARSAGRAKQLFLAGSQK